VESKPLNISLPVWRALTANQFLQVGDFLFPNNLPANAQGNGYSDPNVLIAPAMGGVQVDGGAFNVREGDHSVDRAATYDLKPKLSPFAQITADYRDADVVTGWSPKNPSLNAWLAFEASFGNGFLERLEHRHQYKMNGHREFKSGHHDVSWDRLRRLFAHPRIDPHRRARPRRYGRLPATRSQAQFSGGGF
jgi:hypothetical protein